MEGHNTWCVNRPGSLLVIPVADIAQHKIANLCFFAQNGYAIYDDVNGRADPRAGRSSADLVDVDDPLPLTFLEQYSLTEATAELAHRVLRRRAACCRPWAWAAGCSTGSTASPMLGASGDPDVPGLGFRYDHGRALAAAQPDRPRRACSRPSARRTTPTWRAAVEAFAERKFGPGGPFHPRRPGRGRDSPRVRGSAQVHDERFKACVALQAQYILDTFGKFPGTVPTLFIMNYVQAHHLDLDFYDRFFEPGAYLRSHAEHMQRWHA